MNRRCSPKVCILVQSALLVLICASQAAATTYKVGPGMPFSRIGNVPWSTLKGGDTVYIYYKPTPYYEKFLISGRGTPNAWIRVLGVPGPQGQLPIISGNGATTSTNMHYRWQDASGGSSIQSNGVIQIAVRADDSTGTPSVPGYIEIANLQVQDGYRDYQFQAENGTVANYAGFSACIYARSVQHLIVRNNILTNCGLGFYNWTGSGTHYWDGLQADTVLRGNYFFGNGVPSNYSMHQSYTESDGVTIEYNRFGPMRAGSFGSQIKDRSAGTVVRYNYIESAAGWMIDLVEPQESYAAIGGKASHDQTQVYGNMLMNAGTPNIVHWNEDTQTGAGRASGVGSGLLFYGNTVSLSVKNASEWMTFSLFNRTWGAYDCPPYAQPGVIDMRNNVVAIGPGVPSSTSPTIKFEYCNSQAFTTGQNTVTAGWVIK